MFTENIRAWRDGASDDDVSAGRDWYPFARKVSRELASAYGVSEDVSAGIIAVLSPRADWGQNLAAAETVLRAHRDGTGFPTGIPGVYGGNVRKAWNIAQHGDSYPRCDGTKPGRNGRRVTCTAGTCPHGAGPYLHGPKVHEFHATIGGKHNGRTMDVWATRAADVHPGEVLTLAADDPRREGIPGTRFATLQDAYTAVAAEFGETPRVTQAIVWTRIRRSWLRADGRRSGIRASEFPF